MRWLSLTALVMATSITSSCSSGPTPGPSQAPSSGIQMGMGWRTVAIFADVPDPAAGFSPYNIAGDSAGWLGDVAGRLHVLVHQHTLALTPLRFASAWISFGAEGDEHPTEHGHPSGLGLHVRDVSTHYYRWDSTTLFRSRLVMDTPESVPIFSGMGVFAAGEHPLVATANRALDIRITGASTLNAPGSSMIRDGLSLFAQAHDAMTGVNYRVVADELLLERDRNSGSYYDGNFALGFVAFQPVGSVPYAFQIGSYGFGRTPRQMLQVFTPSTDVSPREPSFRVLRRTQAIALSTTPTELAAVATPTNLWLIVVDPMSWSVYRFDRATANLTLSYRMAPPIDSGFAITSRAVTDDGVIYLRAHSTDVQVERVERIVRIDNGVATDLWRKEFARNADFTLSEIYSTGARVYAALSDGYPFTYTGNRRLCRDQGPGGCDAMTFQRARWTFITPEIAAAVAPAVPPAAPAFVPPQSCNPITNAPCTNGQACDFGPSRTGFACYPVGSASLCEPCNPRTGPHCAQGHLCVLRDDNDPASGQCLRTCCNQDDCGGPRVGRCERSGRGSVGMCAMLNEVMFSPLCAGIPAVQPSGGMCGG